MVRTAFPPRTLRRAVAAGILTLCCAPLVRADDAPPVKITMPPDTRQAVAGEIYQGTFVVIHEAAGVFARFRISGEGWTVLDAAYPREGYLTTPGRFEIRFRARPTDPDAPIGLELTFDDQTVHRSYVLGPAGFDSDRANFRAERRGPRPEPQAPGGSAPPAGRGGAIPLRFSGRIVYDRIGNGSIPPRTLGVDGLTVRVLDDDPVGSETLWEGVTDVHGEFDSGEFSWDDCDISGCDDPDLILEFDTENDVVDITDNSLEEFTYHVELPEVTDFGGGHYNFGPVAVGDPSFQPALHIWNTIVRTNRFLAQNGIDLPQVQVEWPDESLGNAGAHYERIGAEIHISSARQWEERVAAHEYGHHLLHEFTDPVGSDYCNDWCDGEDSCTAGTDCEDTGHCLGCPENEHDAWNEGFPDWLADIALRWVYETIDDIDGSPMDSIYIYNQNSPGKCCQDDQFHDDEAEIVETFVAALLRDIDDPDFDHHAAYGNLANSIRDVMCLGPEEIFDVVVQDEPNTLGGFVGGFLARYPQHTSDLRLTLQNVADSLLSVAVFPPDVQPLGPVTSLDSPSHPLGQGGNSYCVTVTWDRPADDVLGACTYDFEWGTTPNLDPEVPIETVDSLGCRYATRQAFSTLGPKYFAIEAHECETGNGTATAVFGPFDIQDCNGSGLVDLCDISCGHTGTASCPMPGDACDQAGCGQSQDCNGNLAPDECDIADGTSEDCNENGIPDECEAMKHWAGGDGAWGVDARWVENLVPQDGDDVCIRDPGLAATVTYSAGTTAVATLASDESLKILGADLVLAEPSWVRGDLELSGSGASLQVDDRLDVDGTFTWIGLNNSNAARLMGAGSTHLHGDFQNPSGVILLQDHELVLEPGATATMLGRIDSIGASSFSILPGAELSYAGTNWVFHGGAGDFFYNGGTLRKTGPSAASVAAPYFVDGLIHVEEGSLGMDGAGQIAGQVVGDPGTTFEIGCGGQELLPTSSVVADRVLFDGNTCGARTIRGGWDVALETVVATGSGVTFTAEADIVGYGQNLRIQNGSATFLATVGAPLHFDLLQVNGQARFYGGDPIVADAFQFNGTIYGPTSLTVNGPFAWPQSTAMFDLSPVRLNAPVTLTPGGGARSANNTVVQFASLALFDGALQVNTPSSIEVLPTGSVELHVDGNVLNSGLPGASILNQGAFAKTAGTGTSYVRPAFANQGALSAQSGTLALKSFVQTTGETLLDGGNLAAVQIAEPLTFAGGTLRGDGMLTGTVANTGAAVEPGPAGGGAAGTLVVNGAFQQSGAGRLGIELGGPIPGVEHDQLVVTGASAAAQLGGVLDVRAIGGFIPPLGSFYDAILSPVVSGAFDSIQTAGLPPGLDVRVVDFPEGVRIQVWDPACDGLVPGGACPDAVCFGYDPAGAPQLSTIGGPDCATAGVLPAAVDVVRGKLSALQYGAGTVDLGPVTPVQCATTQSAFLWSGPPPAPGEGEFYLVRPVGAGDYGQASGGELRLAGAGDCP